MIVSVLWHLRKFSNLNGFGRDSGVSIPTGSIKIVSFSVDSLLRSGFNSNWFD